MKRTPLKRTKGLSRGEGLKRGDSQLKRTQIKGRSDKRAKFMRETRAPAVAELREQGITCKVSPILEAAGLGGYGCTGLVTGLHERRKRSSGGSLINPCNLIPACSWCNGLIEDEPELIRTYTGTSLVVREGDEEWDALGARNDRISDDADVESPPARTREPSSSSDPDDAAS